ncbi:HAD-IIIC family phosphatase [Sphingomonas sp.]|uniref:HAD-IIIC family phosphatase n=1 Tax=Sphingomonas sp. TaxID=28214 RepID=UPI003AFFD179
MNAALFTDLGWLPKCADFKAGCRGIIDGDSPAGLELRRLASHALSSSQLQRLTGLLDDLEMRDRSTAALAPLKIALVGTGTLSLVSPVLRGTGLRYGLSIQCITAGYGQLEQEALNPRSLINSAGVDIVLVALDYRGLPLGQAAVDAADAAARVDASVATLRTVCRGIRANSGVRIMLQTLAPPTETLFGSLDASWAGSIQAMVAAFNRAVAAECEDASTFLLDTAHLANTVGLASWHDPAQWNMAKFPFSAELLPLYADHVCRVLCAMQGKARRALVLDLDNTLWGGIIGDDGLHGITIGEGDATGEAFMHVQRLALALRSRGVVLAVCSKNMDEIARLPFSDHPDMVLRADHIASFKANWQDKASNIRSIAAELSLGLDSFVFLDDNPAERELVRHYLPEVAVPELPEDPAYYARTLAAAGYFEAVSFSQEDRARADYYQANTARAVLMDEAGDIDDFLSGLQMQASLQPFDAIGRSRIHQLILKSNQFNLTTRRYSEMEIAELEGDPSVFTLQVRLKDRLGDNGMISVVVCRTTAPQTWTIDTWLMSCRVLRRGVELLVLREILQHARARGIHILLGIYRPTTRNGLVRNHYADLGFTFERDGESGETVWSLRTDVDVEASWFEVIRPRAATSLAA